MNLSTEKLKNVPVSWKPTGEVRESAERFKQILQEKYKIETNDYWKLHRWTIENLVEFWSEFWDYIGIKCSQRFHTVIDRSVPLSERPLWFEGARLNYAENVLRYRNDEIALVLTGEARTTQTVTFAELYRNVEMYAAALRKYGMQKGDIVISYISNREEPIYAMLAVASIGAIWSAIQPILGAEALIRRFEHMKPRILLTVDRFHHDKKVIEMLPKLKHISKEMPSIEKILIVPTGRECQEEIQDIRNSCLIQDFLQLGVEEDGTVPPLEFEQLPFSHPVFIIRTSGTTGLPKGLIHGCGVLLTMSNYYYLNHLGTKNNVIISAFPPETGSWVLNVTQLFFGSKIIVYEGVPSAQSSTHVWDMVDDFGIASLFFTPTALDFMEKTNRVPTKEHNLDSLKAVISGSAIARAQNYDFVHSKIKKDVIFSSTYGSTEILCNVLAYDVSLPIYTGEITCPCFGVDIQCLDVSGNAVVGEIGEIVLASPIPSMTLGLWGDTDGSLYKKTYFSKYTDKFEFGDAGYINPFTKGIVIYGRSDDTLNINSRRFGCSDIYNIVNKLPEVMDSLCVAQFSKDRNARAVLFIKMVDGFSFDDKFVLKIRTAITNEMAMYYVPELILETKDIPYNRYGKKMEIIVKNLINNLPYNVEAIVNKESLENFRNVPPFQ